MHSLLKRQLKRAFGDPLNIPAEWEAFIEMVNSAYQEADMDRNMIERSLEISSQELLQANAELRAIFEAMPDVFFRIDSSGTILDCKTGYISDLFIPREQLIGRKIYDIPLVPVAEKFRHALAETRLTSAPQSFEYSLTLQKNENFYEARLIPLPDDQLIMIVRNITDRKKAESDLRKSEEYFREITVNASDVIFVVDATGAITYASPSCERITGYRPEELIGKNSLHLIVKDDRARAVEDFYRALSTRNASIPNSFRIRHKNGAEIFLAGFGKILLDHPVIAGFLMNVRDVTEQKKAEEALRESEKTYRLLTEKMSDIVWIADMNLRTVYVSPSVETSLGFTQKERLSQTIDQQLTPESLSRGLEALEKELSLEERADADPNRQATIILEYYHKDGSTRWMETLMTGMRNDEGRLIGLHGVTRDVTERKQAQEALVQSEQNYRILASCNALLNDISISFAEAASAEDLQIIIPESLRCLTGAMGATYSAFDWQTDALEIVYLSVDEQVSDQIKSFFGHGLIGMRIPVTKDNRQMMIERGIWRLTDINELSFGAVSKELSDATREAVGYRLIIGIAIFNAGELIGACSAYFAESELSISDDTLKTFAHLCGIELIRRQAQDIIRKSEELYRTVFESTATANIILAEDTTILMANNNYARLSGYSREELEGKMSAFSFIHPDDLGRLKSYHKKRRIDAKLAPLSYEFRFVNRSGEMKDIYACVDIIAGSRESIASLTDLTEIRHLENQLTQAQKMDSIGRLAGGVAHDFNNMLAVIIGNAEIALSKANRSDPLYKTLQNILNAAERSVGLTRQLLAFARKQTISPKVLDLNETIAGMLKMLQRLIGENIELIWHPGHNLSLVKIDPSQVDQILANLAVNARDSIEKAGKIIIETANKICDEAYRNDNPECVPGKYVVLTVSDNGLGMPKETMDNIFEPFFTTKKNGQGTGLGLATVYGIVKQNNGFINVYSEPGLGSAFKVYLPCHINDQAQEELPALQTKIQGGEETILIVEDEESVLNLTKDMLEIMGYKVLTARYVEQALQTAREYDGKIDLLLTDVVMPNTNGKELSEKIRDLRPGVKCLFMSGYTADIIARHGIIEEGIMIISKPFSLKELSATVREALG